MKMVTVVQGERPDSHRTPSQLSSLSLPARIPTWTLHAQLAGFPYPTFSQPWSACAALHSRVSFSSLSFLCFIVMNTNTRPEAPEKP